jgi:hypothetical protein
LQSIAFSSEMAGTVGERSDAVLRTAKAEKWAARSARLAATLRENLKRRKEQARERNIQRDLQHDLARNRPTGEDFVPDNAEKEIPVGALRRHQSRE